MKKKLGLLGGALLLSLVGGAWIGRIHLRHPHPLFAYSCELNNLRLRSDKPFGVELGREILGRVEEKLVRSPIFERTTIHEAFICQELWHRRLYVGDSVAALNYFPTTGLPFVFLRAARLYDNRLLSPRGLPIGGKRTLDYYIAHEFTHTMTFHFAPAQVPKWLDEGYADWVGLGALSTYENAADDLRQADPELRAELAGDYLKYDFMVAHLLDRKHANICELLRHPPDAGEVERAARQ